MARRKDGFDCDVCRQTVIWSVLGHRPALLCSNCGAKYDSKTGKRDRRFKPLPRESWLLGIGSGREAWR